MKVDTFNGSFIGITTLAVILIVLASVGVIFIRIIAVAGDVAATGILLCYPGKEYTGC